MAIIGEWLRRLGYLLRRQEREDELRQEMEAHREQMGQPPAFGNMLRLREDARDAWGWRWLDSLAQDTRFAWRTLRRSPGFSITVIASLSLGIGVNTGMFSFVNGLLVRPMYAGAEDIFGVHSRSPLPTGGPRAFSYPNYRDLEAGTTDIFANLAASSLGFVGLDAGDGPRRTMAFAVTANYFEVFAALPARGRPFTVEEEQPGAGIRVAIISHSLWERRGADPEILGRLVRINGEAFTVVGVAPKGFTGPSIPGPEVWLPLGAYDTVQPTGASGSPPFGAREAHELASWGGAAWNAYRNGQDGAAAAGGGIRAAFPRSTPTMRSRFQTVVAARVHARCRKRRIYGSGAAFDAHAGDRSARRLSQPGRSVAGARSRAPAGTSPSGRPRRQSIAPHSAARQKDAARAGRRGGRVDAVDVGDQDAVDVTRFRSPGVRGVARHESRLAGHPRHRRFHPCRHAGVWGRPALVSTGRAAARISSGIGLWGAKTGRRQRAPADRQCSRHRADCALSSAARVRRTVPDERAVGGNSRSRIPSRWRSTAEVDPGLAGCDEARGRQSQSSDARSPAAVPGVEAVTFDRAFRSRDSGTAARWLLPAVGDHHRLTRCSA